MIVSEAVLAPTSPPETGASTHWRPSALTRFTNFLVSSGEIELMPSDLTGGQPLGESPLAEERPPPSGVSGTTTMTTSLA
jgi:hypothetical protein